MLNHLRILLYTLALLCQSTVGFAFAVQNPAQLCDAAAQEAANRTGVPVDVLLAITRTETGRKGSHGLQPWPWAINEGGKGQWFDSADAALAYANEQISTGVTNIDIGCFQLNHRWHSQGFPSLDAMFDPLQNALYAADFLRRNFDKTSDWSLAAGAYHSGTPEYATRYRKKFDSILAALKPEDLNVGTPADLMLASLRRDESSASPRENSFPLLIAQDKGLRGSLVGVSGFRRPLIGNN